MRWGHMTHVGGGGGALEAPLDRHRQERRTGTSRAEQTDRDHGGAGSSGDHGRWSSGPLASTRLLQPEPYYPPKKKNPWGSEGGIRSPPGLNRQDSTKHDRTALQGQTDRTEHDDRKALQGPTDRTSHRNQKPSWASSEAEASSGHDQESGALTGSLSDRLHFSNKGAGG